MAEIVRLFHGSAIVEDVLAAGRFYHDFFGSWVYEAQHLETEGSINSANVIGGSFSLEMLAPLDRKAETPVARFLRRHGSHFNTVAFWVKDCRGIAERLLDHGVRVALRGRGVVESIGGESFDYMITHPRDTGGTVFEFLEDQKIRDPRDQSWWTDDWWRERHPLGIEALSHCTVAVRDLDKAGRFYSDVLGCKLLHEEHDPARHAQCRFFSVGDTVVELASPLLDDCELGREIAAHGPIVHAFSFQVRDLARVRAHAAECGLDFSELGARGIELDPAQTFGGRFGFCETRPYAA